MTGEPVALGIDVGLSGTRTALVAADGGVLATGACPRHSVAQREGEDGMPARWRHEITEATRQALASAPSVEVAALAVGAVGPCTVLVDARLEAMADPLLFSETGGEWGSASPDGAFAGDVLPSDHVLPALAAFAARRPDVVAAASFALDATGYLVGWLTGEPVMDDITAFDYVVPGSQPLVALPTPRPPQAIAGALLPPVAEALGLPAGLPVAVGAYDSYVDLLAMGLRRPGDAGLLLGSTMVAAALAAPGIEPRAHGLGLRTVRWPLGDAVLVGGWTSSAGAALDWSRRLLALSDEEEGTAGLLDPGSGGLVSLPYLAGERTPVWDEHASGAVVGLTAATTRPQLHRAVLDGVVLSTRQVMRTIAECAPPRAGWRAAAALATPPGCRRRRTASATSSRCWTPAGASPPACSPSPPSASTSSCTRPGASSPMLGRRLATTASPPCTTPSIPC